MNVSYTILVIWLQLSRVFKEPLHTNQPQIRHLVRRCFIAFIMHVLEIRTYLIEASALAPLMSTLNRTIYKVHFLHDVFQYASVSESLANATQLCLKTAQSRPSIFFKLLSFVL